MVDDELVGEKVAQAEERLATLDLDCWLTVARETTEVSDPALDLVCGFDVVWETAVFVTPDGANHVVIGRYDAPSAEDLGVYDVHPYDESFEEAFLETVERIDPDSIGVNYDETVPAADGLTHGLYRRLEDLFVGTAYEGRLESASPVMTELLARKTPTEMDQIRKAATETEALLAEATAAWTPDWTEAEFASYLYDRMREEGYGSAWSWDYCPTVHAGGDAPVGHTLPGDRTLPPGEVLHVDFGVRRAGYAADLQRLYFYSGPDGLEPPADLQAAFEDVRAAIDATFDSLEPGAVGHEVDAAAREELTGRGWPEYKHATGHAVGRNAHDVGALLGPRWDRYGDRPDREVRPGEIYMLELGVETEWGYLGGKEMVEVTDDGATYVVEPQEEFRVLEE